MEIFRADLKDDFEKNRFALSALAARIHEELILWQSLSKYLKRLEASEELQEKEMKDYLELSQRSQSLTILIIKTADQLEISEKEGISNLLESINNKLLQGANGEQERQG